MNNDTAPTALASTMDSHVHIIWRSFDRRFSMRRGPGAFIDEIVDVGIIVGECGNTTAHSNLALAPGVIFNRGAWAFTCRQYNILLRVREFHCEFFTP